MIQGTEPFPLDQTCPLPSEYRSLQEWDQSYWDRAKTYPVFLICAAQYLNLHNPPAITEKKMYGWFGRTCTGRTRGTENPYCKIEQPQLDDLKRFYSIKS